MPAFGHRQACHPFRSQVMRLREVPGALYYAVHSDSLKLDISRLIGPKGVGPGRRKPLEQSRGGQRNSHQPLMTRHAWRVAEDGRGRLGRAEERGPGERTHDAGEANVTGVTLVTGNPRAQDSSSRLSPVSSRTRPRALSVALASRLANASTLIEPSRNHSRRLRRSLDLSSRSSRSISSAKVARRSRPALERLGGYP